MDNARYSTVAVVLHWTIAILILAQIAGGLYMHKLPNASPDKFDLYQLHKSFGLSVLALSLLRLFWRVGHKPPAMPLAMPGWQKLAAHLVLVGFYALMIATPLAGLAMVSVSPLDIPTKFFGVIPVPHLPFLGGGDLKAAEDFWKEVHEYLAFSILFLLALHVGAALKHKFVNKDGVLRSMSSPRAGLGIGAIFAMLGLGVGVYFLAPAPTVSPVVFEPVTVEENLASGEAGEAGENTDTTLAVEAEGNGEAGGNPATPEPTEQAAVAAAETSTEDASVHKLPVSLWDVDYDTSRLAFIGEEKGNSFEGKFGGYQAVINFSPDDLAGSSIRVDVATGGITTGDALRDSTVPSKEWFHTKEHPTAYFASSAIRHKGGDTYEAEGVLHIKTYQHPVTLDFTLVIDGDTAVAKGSADLVRTNYGLGLGSGWTDDEDVGLNVRVEFEINAGR